MPASFHDRPLAERLAVHTDTPEMSGALRRIAATLPPETGYWLKEAADSLDGLYDMACEAADNEP